ncbi:hypothetical protein ERJ75_000499400 [Trypanosoma vivax]|nr:hypothetical protein ERJ75_000499400 [Trypanosoma vivax]
MLAEVVGVLLAAVAAIQCEAAAAGKGETVADFAKLCHTAQQVMGAAGTAKELEREVKEALKTEERWRGKLTRCFAATTNTSQSREAAALMEQSDDLHQTDRTASSTDIATHLAA